MKKLLALLLAIVLCFTLCACGGTQKMKNAVIGTWIREYEFNGTNYTTTIQIFKGGTGTFDTKEDGKRDYLAETLGGVSVPDSITWEIVDNVLNIYIEDSGTNIGFIYTDEKDETLQSVDGTKIYLRANETN